VTRVAAQAFRRCRPSWGEVDNDLGVVGHVAAQPCVRRVDEFLVDL
jgi:hypothetical protein